jgi:hypothetical protein
MYILFKLQIVQFAKSHTYSLAARTYAVERKRFNEWRKIEENLRECKDITKKHWRGGGKM